MNAESLLTEVREIRSRNNILWMDLVALAIELDSVRAKEILKKITENDKQISSIIEKMTE